MEWKGKQDSHDMFTLTFLKRSINRWERRKNGPEIKEQRKKKTSSEKIKSDDVGSHTIWVEVLHETF